MLVFRALPFNVGSRAWLCITFLYGKNSKTSNAIIKAETFLYYLILYNSKAGISFNTSFNSKKYKRWLALWLARCQTGLLRLA